MKFLFTFLGFLAAQAASADSIQSLTCESFMAMGFESANERGTFTYVASPLKISVIIAGREHVISDASLVCTVGSPAAVTYSVTESEGSGWKDVYVKSPASGDNPDGGTLSVRGDAGLFTCPFLLDVYSQIDLHGCTLR